MKALILGIMLLCPALQAFGEDGGRIFTNGDLRKYTREEGATVYPEPAAGERKGRSDKGKTRRQDAVRKKKDYYCRQGTKYKRTLDDAEQMLKKCEEHYYQKRKAAHFRIAEEGGCAHEKRVFHHARATYQDLSDEARRENIPDGWLRCQFE